MPKRSKKPADLNRLAAAIVDEATEGPKKKATARKQSGSKPAQGQHKRNAH